MMKLPDAVLGKLDCYFYTRELLRAGYTKIGSGAFGQVFAKEGDAEVIKVGGVNSDGYIQFVQRVGLRSSNPHLPYIRKIEIFDQNPNSPHGDSYYVLRMERLSESPKNVSASFALQELGVTALWHLHNPEKISPKTRAANYVKSVLMDLYKHYAADIKWGNVLFRDNTLVITDPVACYIG